MSRLLRLLFSPERNHLPTGPERDTMVIFWANMRDANSYLRTYY